MSAEPHSNDFAADPAGWLRDAADMADLLLRTMNQPAAAGSAMAQERAAIAGRFDEPAYEHGDVGQHMVEAVALYASRYAAHVVRSVRELADAIDRRAFASLPPVVRSHVEFAARGVWLVEPIVGNPADAAFERVCRMNLDLYVSKCYVRTTLENLGSPDADQAKDDRDQAATEIGNRFSDPEPQLKWGGVGTETKFTIGGFTYAGLTQVTKRFLKTWEHPDVSAEGIYDALSGLSHPSQSFLAEQLEEIELDTHRLVHWDVDADFIIRLASYSHVALMKLIDSLAAFVGREEQPAAEA